MDDVQNSLVQGEGSTESSPEHVPPKAWVTLVLFAAFVVAFGTCATQFLFK